MKFRHFELDDLITQDLDQFFGDKTRKYGSRGPLEEVFVFRKLVNCGSCDYKLIGELQSGIVYYRCHTKECSSSIREDFILQRVKKQLLALKIEEQEGSGRAVVEY